MRLLLDSHTLLWWWAGSPNLPQQLRDRIASPNSEIFVSAVSAWEIATKTRIGMLAGYEGPAEHFVKLMDENGFKALAVTVDHGLHAGRYNAEHRDPFDRILAAQSELEDIPIISRDTALDVFGCVRIWD